MLRPLHPCPIGMPNPLQKFLSGGTLSSTRSRSAVDDEDGDVEAQIARNLWKNYKIIPPNSVYKNRWDLFVIVLVLCVHFHH